MGVCGGWGGGVARIKLFLLPLKLVKSLALYCWSFSSVKDLVPADLLQSPNTKHQSLKKKHGAFRGQRSFHTSPVLLEPVTQSKSTGNSSAFTTSTTVTDNKSAQEKITVSSFANTSKYPEWFWQMWGKGECERLFYLQLQPRCQGDFKQFVARVFPLFGVFVLVNFTVFVQYLQIFLHLSVTILPLLLLVFFRVPQTHLSTPV